MGKQEPSNKQQHSSAFSKQESTITLKVLIHCEGCKRKVKRIIKCVDGVDSVNIEAEYSKVTVVGRGVDAKEVVNSLNKAGKHAEIWQFGGGKMPLNASQMAAGMANNNGTGEKNKMKAVGFEKLQEKNNNNNNNNNNKNNNFPKGKGSPENAMHGGMSANYMGGANKGKGGEMIELANAGPSFNLVPPPKPPFPVGGFTPGGHFDRPNLPTNNIAILSKSVAPRPSIFHGETSLNPHDNSENATAEYATHLFSDENANNCSVM